ncbi:hypothetical protein ACF06X_14660 [Streptomyces sp. NPDC015346]|uniref:hypothetical protein n=1 Tax=Streptomyces sp. NPDC015346 TaxID=3364954 RepID=UPI0036FF79B1
MRDETAPGTWHPTTAIRYPTGAVDSGCVAALNGFEDPHTGISLSADRLAPADAG